MKLRVKYIILQHIHVKYHAYAKPSNEMAMIMFPKTAGTDGAETLWCAESRARFMQQQVRFMYLLTAGLVSS